MGMNIIKKIVGQTDRPVVRVGTVLSGNGSRYRVEDDGGGCFFARSVRSWPVGARVILSGDMITGPGPQKKDIQVVEV